MRAHCNAAQGSFTWHGHLCPVGAIAQPVPRSVGPYLLVGLVGRAGRCEVVVHGDAGCGGGRADWWAGLVVAVVRSAGRQCRHAGLSPDSLETFSMGARWSEIAHTA
jgi:hypothetical protein